MPTKTKKAAVISVILFTAALIAAAICLILFPYTVHFTKEIRCYSGQSGVSDT